MSWRCMRFGPGVMCTHSECRPDDGPISFRPMATALSPSCKTCGGTGGISATSPGEKEKGYVQPCPDCHPANETSAPIGGKR